MLRVDFWWGMLCRNGQATMQLPWSASVRLCCASWICTWYAPGMALAPLSISSQRWKRQCSVFATACPQSQSSLLMTNLPSWFHRILLNWFGAILISMVSTFQLCNRKYDFVSCKLSCSSLSSAVVVPWSCLFRKPSFSASVTAYIMHMLIWK